MKTSREKEDRHNRWLAAVNGIDLGKESNDTAYDIVEEKKRKLQAEQQGMSYDEFEFDEFGIDIETE